MSETGFTTTFGAFNRAMQRKVDALGMAGAVVVRTEAGSLARTLINITPPVNRAKTKKKIEDKVEGKFATLASENPRPMQAGAGDVYWYAFQPKAIFGVARDKDLTGASADDLYKAYFATAVNRQGRVIAGQRGKQTVYLWQRFLTKAKTVKALAQRLVKHVGRLKAGWLVSFEAVGAPPGTLGPVPQWIMAHRSGARGYVLDGLGVPDAPTFTLANYAVGAGKLQPFVESAMKLRAKAMAADILLYWKGVKHL